jgi:DNA-binding transcriptional ArsR family regulator
MYCLCREELCVCDVAHILGMSVQAVSHHLRLLRALRLVRSRREGKLVFYSLDDAHVAGIIQQGLEHLSHTEA